MDDLIVIILTLVVAGFGILGQFKKKKQEAAGTTPPKQPGNFWDLIKNEPDFPTQEEEIEYFEEEIPEPIDSPVTGYQKIESLRKKKSVIENEVTQESARKKTRFNVKEEFSLREAVIYSEILNRKYK
ncbi:MAG: hypothetical protein GQ525_10955 [Draconibacterium sp.]|nr:hypothetical protein [Draconibacterium sp.]